MEDLIAELKKLVPFKDSTVEGDIVLLASDDPRAIVYAFVTDITRDAGRKDPWWDVTMQVLSVPPSEVVWTLREPQFTGREIFTFGGIKHFMKAVRFPAQQPRPIGGGEGREGKTRPRGTGLRVVK